MSSLEDVKVDTISLNTLPIEVFLMICDYIDADTLIRSLMHVNKQFYDIISDIYLWKRRVMRKFNDCNVAFMLTNNYNENTFKWNEFAWYTELEDKCWSSHETNTTTTVFKDVHFSEVDTVIITKGGDQCISASRDRSICVWDLSGSNSNSTVNPLVHKIDGHTGWIWDLKVYDKNHFLSSSWDSYVKLWNMDNFSQDAEPIQSFISDSAVLSITNKHNFIAAGLYIPKIIAFDPRESDKRLFELRPHKRSIIELCLIQDHYLISLSEDKTLSVWDLRTHSRVKSMYLAKQGGRFPMCASYYDNVLFIGDSQDHMYWLDCSQGLFDILETVQIIKPISENQRHYKFNDIKCTNYGSIITGGNEGVIYILTPTNPTKIIAKIESSGSEITSIDYQNDKLVVGNVNSEIRVWKKN